MKNKRYCANQKQLALSSFQEVSFYDWLLAKVKSEGNIKKIQKVRHQEKLADDPLILNFEKFTNHRWEFKWEKEKGIVLDALKLLKLKVHSARFELATP